MSDLYLIRHAQASFHREDYDQLSDLGYEQSQYLAQRIFHKIEPERYYSGSLKRHSQTLKPLINLNNNKHSMDTQVNILSGFDEFNYFDVLQQFRKEWRTKKDMMLEIQQSENPQKTFEDSFRQSIKRWVDAKNDHEYAETWQEFKQRVVQAMAEVIDSAPSASKTIVMTSGGPISVICQHLLKLSDQQTFEVNAALVNTGITRIKFNTQRCSLHGLNDIAHLEDQQTHFITYR